MGSLLLILAIVAAVLLVLVIIIQNPKGGGIDSSFGAANQLGSVQKTTDVVEKATWYLAVFIVVISLATTAIMSGATNTEVIEGEGKFDPDYRFNQMPVNTPATNPGGAADPFNTPQ